MHEIKDYGPFVIATVALGTLCWSVWFNLRMIINMRVANLNAIVQVERSLKDTPTAFKFHGITDEMLKTHGITPEELSYLAASFTAGGVYHRALQPKETGSFPLGSYRYQMLLSPDTRKAWPLIKLMMNQTTYTDRIEATIRQIQSAQPAAPATHKFES